MVKMTFARTIKYKDVIHPANSVVIAEDKDVMALKASGGTIIAEDAVAAEAKKSEAEDVKKSEAEEKIPPTKRRKRG